jgi:hypothetical protein
MNLGSPRRNAAVKQIHNRQKRIPPEYQDPSFPCLHWDSVVRQRLREIPHLVGQICSIRIAQAPIFP